jgi:hypothetical protein
MAKTLISRSNGMREISSIRMVLFIAVLIIFVFPSGNIAREGGRPADSGLESRWMEILKIAGADPPEGAKADAVLGPLPSDDELKSGGGLSTGEFIDAFNSPNAARGLMRDFARARLRELGRRGFLDSVAVEAVLGPEPRGVSGSRFFMIPPIPGDSFQTLIDYILAAALAVPGGDYMPSLDDRLKIDRALQASFAISSPRVRMQYMDFDVVWTTAQMELSCARSEKRASLTHDMIWLYLQVKDSAGLDRLPSPPDRAAEKILDQGSGLFSRAREISRTMPESLAAVTAWKCE